MIQNPMEKAIPMMRTNRMMRSVPLKRKWKNKEWNRISQSVRQCAKREVQCVLFAFAFISSSVPSFVASSQRSSLLLLLCSDYYQLISFEIGDLKLLICAEIDCVDKDGKGMEIKYGDSDQEVSTWSQCFLSKVTTVVQAHKTRQTDCSVVTGLETKEIDGFYDSENHRNAQMMVFYNVLKQIKNRLQKETEGKKEDFVKSSIIRLGRYGSHQDATMFTVGDEIRDLITKEDWEYLKNVKKEEKSSE